MSSHQTDKATFLERLIFNNRPAVIIICLLVSVFLFWQATLIKPSTSFEKMIPLEHPFIEKMMEHRNDLANLGNTVRISVEAKDGDIFTKDYMETLRQIHDEVFYISGVDRSGLKSLWSPSVRWTEVTEEGFAGGEVIPQSYNGSAQSLDQLRNNVLKSGQVGYAGLDVYEEEEGVFFQDLSGQILGDDTLARLLTFPNVLITSHQAFLTHQALQNIADTTLKNIAEFESGAKLQNEVKAP